MTHTATESIGPDLNRLADEALADRAPSRAEALALLALPDEAVPALLQAAWKVRFHFHGRRVQVQALSNAKSGLCSEDCHYCSQSCVSKADILRHPLKTLNELLEEARGAQRIQARRLCMGLSGRTLTDEETEGLAGILHAIKAETGLALCCSLGFLTPAQARRLKAAGLDRVNHNLNTSARHYPAICTTHTYDDRINNIRICRDAGLEVCSGGIVGQGETNDDIVDLLLALRELGPDSVPINFLIPVPGTPFEHLAHGLTPMRCLKILALARLIHPRPDLRVAGGREYHLRSLQPMALFVANSIFVNGYLTEAGQPHDEALKMIADLGFEPELEGASSTSH